MTIPRPAFHFLVLIPFNSKGVFPRRKRKGVFFTVFFIGLRKMFSKSYKENSEKPRCLFRRGNTPLTYMYLHLNIIFSYGRISFLICEPGTNKMLCQQLCTELPAE